MYLVRTQFFGLLDLSCLLLLVLCTWSQPQTRDGQYQKFEPNTNTQYLWKALNNTQYQYQYLWMSLNNTNTQYQYQQKTQYPIPIPNTLLNNTACYWPNTSPNTFKRLLTIPIPNTNTFKMLLTIPIPNTNTTQNPNTNTSNNTIVHLCPKQ